MTTQEYIQSKLEELRQPLGLSKPDNDALLADAVFKAVMSKKFRKYSVNPEYVEHIKSAIQLCIDKKEPIKFSMVFGGYKLWQLSETPEPDWAELFSMLYYASWVKPICELYEPGVWFDFVSDDVIVSKLNNIPTSDVKTYQKSFNELLAFMKPYLPKNLNMTLTRIGDQYENDAAFEADLNEQIKGIQRNLPNGLPELIDEMRATIELNVKVSSEQKLDSLWREKVQLLHDGYAQVTKRRPYYRQPDKLMVVTKTIPNSIAVGTTKDSIMKFWIGTGVLRANSENFRQIILSPSQLEHTKFDWERVKFDGLSGKNFSKVRVI